MKLKELKEKNLIGKVYTGGNFHCGANQLTSLKGAPSKVVGYFNCRNNLLTSLEGAPSEVGNGFYCGGNQLTSLKGAPSKVDGYFDCSINQLTSLKGAPSKVDSDFDCGANRLTSLEGAPSEVGDSFYCRGNQLTSLHDIHKIIKKCKHFYCNNNKIKDSILGLLLIQGLLEVEGDHKAFKILNKYLGKGKMGLYDCQTELTDAGFDDYAQL